MAEEEQNTWDNVRDQAEGFRESIGSDEQDHSSDVSSEDIQESPEMQETMANADEPEGFRESLGDEAFADEQPYEGGDSATDTDMPEGEDRAAY